MIQPARINPGGEIDSTRVRTITEAGPKRGNLKRERLHLRVESPKRSFQWWPDFVPIRDRHKSSLVIMGRRSHQQMKRRHQVAAIWSAISILFTAAALAGALPADAGVGKQYRTTTPI